MHNDCLILEKKNIILNVHINIIVIDYNDLNHICFLYFWKNNGNQDPDCLH